MYSSFSFLKIRLTSILHYIFTDVSVFNLIRHLHFYSVYNGFSTCVPSFIACLYNILQHRLRNTLAVRLFATAVTESPAFHTLLPSAVRLPRFSAALNRP